MARSTKTDAENTRQQLLIDAAYLFETAGYAGASIADICTRAGTTKGALFHHFESKKALFIEVWTILQKQLDADAHNAAIAARSRDDPYSALLAGCRVYLDFATRRDYQNIVLIDGPSVLGQAGWYESDHNLGYQNVLGGVRYLAYKGRIAEHRVNVLAVMTQSALNGAGFALSRDVEGVTADGIYDAFEALIRGMR